MENKPIKRNENIVILSREHHDGLLFAWKLRQGQKHGIVPERMAPYVSYFWESHLLEHFREEETLLFDKVDSPLVTKAREQHESIKALIATIAGGEVGNATVYSQLADAITDHIRFEERELFPYLESTLSEDQLSQVGAVLEQLHAVPAKDDYADAVWIREKGTLPSR